MNKIKTRIAIVGGGRACYDLLSLIQGDPDGLGLTVVGVADPDPQSPGIQLARECGVDWVGSDYRVLVEKTDLDLVLELTGDPEVRDDLAKLLPTTVPLVDHKASRFFWDFFALVDEKVLVERNRLENILDSLPYEILVIGKDFVVQQANRTFLAHNQLVSGEVVGKYCYDLDFRTKGPCEITIDGCPHAETLKAGQSVSQVKEYVDSKGVERFTAVRAAPIRDDDGNILGVVEAARDITQRVQTEEELKETRARLDQFIDTAPLFIYMKNAKLQYRVINKHALELLGLEEAEVVGKTDFALFPERIARGIQVREREVLRTGKTIRAEGLLPVKNGRINFNATLFPVRQGQEVIGLFGLVEDTTELHKSEEELHREQERLFETRKYLAGILEHSRDMIFLTDLESNILSFNVGAEEVLGYQAAAVVGRSISEFAVEKDGFRTLFKDALDNGHSAAYEVPFRHQNGEIATCNVSMTRINAPDGHPLEVVGICRNITTRLQLREDLIRSERLAAIGKMAAGVAHEINNPLAVIETIAGVIQDTIAEESENLHPSSRDILAKAVERMGFQIKRCSSITHSLLGFVRPSDGGHQPVDIEELLEEAVNLLAPEISGAQVEIRCETPPDLPKPLTDPMLLEQVFVNLMKNAVEAVEEQTDRPGLILIRSVAREGMIEVSVEDNGVGIPPAAQGKIFDLFHTSKPAGKGTGLGLAIVHDIVEKLDAEIAFTSEEGKGTCFTLRLPITPGPRKG